MNTFICRYDFDNFEDPHKFKLKLRNGARFQILNNYYEYSFLPKEYEQALFCYSLLDSKKEAEESIEFSNNVIQYLCCIPIYERDSYIFERELDTSVICKTSNISVKKEKIFKYVSDKILKFKVERKLFDEVINLNRVAFSNFAENRIEDSILYYFKIIEKLAKKNHTKFYEKNYTKKVKQNNKQRLRNFIEEYFDENFKINMTENMLNTAIDDIYIKLKSQAYSSIFLKISFFCNCKNIDISADKLNVLVKTRNKLAHGDIVDESMLESSISTAFWLSNEFIALYFFNKHYHEINIDTQIYDF